MAFEDITSTGGSNLNKLHEQGVTVQGYLKEVTVETGGKFGDSYVFHLQGEDGSTAKYYAGGSAKRVAYNILAAQKKVPMKAGYEDAAKRDSEMLGHMIRIVPEGEVPVKKGAANKMKNFKFQVDRSKGLSDSEELPF